MHRRTAQGTVRRGSRRALRACCVLVTALSAGCPAGPGHDRLAVGVDPRIELIGVVQLLSDGYPVSTELEFPYRVRAEEHFSGFRTHPAVTTFTAMAKTGFSFDAPIALMLHLSNPPSLEVRYELPAPLVARAGGGEKVEEFLRLMRDFARDSRFEAFFAANSGFYGELVEPANRFLADDPLVPEVEAYYGMTQSSYSVILSPLTKGGFGPSVEVSPGRLAVYSVASPTAIEDGALRFFSDSGLRYLVWHEFAHSFVNPLTDAHWSELSVHAGLLAPIEQGLPRWYRDWKAALNEHIVRAVTVRLALANLGPEQGREELARQEKWGFAYVPALAERLEEYEANRDRYPTFASFFPQIVDCVARLDGAAVQPPR